MLTSTGTTDQYESELVITSNWTDRSRTIGIRNPSRVRTRAARKLVEQARADAFRLTSATERELRALNQATLHAREELSSLQAEIEGIQEELARQEALMSRQQQNLNAVEEARRALDAI